MVGFKRILMCMLLAVACQQVEPLVEPEVVEGPEFLAQVEKFDALTKTSLANGKSVVWSSGDQLAIFQGRSVADKYQVKDDCVGSTSGSFSIVASGEGSPIATFQSNVALYPYEEGLECIPVLQDGAVTSYQISGVTIPAVQTYSPGSFSDDSFLMAALTSGLSDHTLKFKNLCGALKLQLKGTTKVKRIELRGNDREPLSGDATVIIHTDSSISEVLMSENASKSVSLTWLDGVQLSEENETSFFITIPPTEFKNGFTVKIVDVLGAEATIETSKPNAVGRSYIHTMPVVSIETVLPTVDESLLNGLSIACIGNSITQGSGAEGKPYPTQLAARLNATVKNLGVSATSLCQGGSRTCNIGQLSESNCAGMDIVTIMMGVNDWAAARNNSTEGCFYHLGDINSTETNCIYGAMRMWCDKIQELKKTESCAATKFYFMTPLITSWNSSVTKTRDWDQSKTNVHGFTLRDLCNAIIDVATLYDIPVIDLNLCSGIYYNSETDENVSLYGGDGVHVNAAGHTLVTDAIIRALAGDFEAEAEKRKQQRIYISPTGSDQNDGCTVDSPIATIAKAREILSEDGELIFLDGDYENLDLNLSDFAELSAYGSNARLLYPRVKITEATSYGGKISCAEIPSSLKSFTANIWQQDVPDANTLIQSSDRLPIQKGKTHRLTNTRIYNVLDFDQTSTDISGYLATMEASELYMYYLDADANKIYFSSPSSDFEAHPVVIPSSKILNATLNRRIKVTGLSFMYATLLTSGLRGTVSDVFVGYTAGSGCIRWDYTEGMTFIGCEVAACKNDGFNGHYAGSVICYDCWGHDCADDGESCHEVCHIVQYGGLYEFNGNGCTPASGGSAEYNNVIVRYNGDYPWVVDNAGTGFSAQGVAASMYCNDCLSINNKIGYRATGTDTYAVITNCVSENDKLAFSKVTQYDCIAR